MSDRKILFIPIYNCEKQISRVLQKLTTQVQEVFDEIILVNNLSTDASEAAAIEGCREHIKIKATVLRNRQNYGLGGSHKVAFKYALKYGYDYCLVLHGDDQGEIEDIMGHLKKGEHHKYDCLLNSRFMPGSLRRGYSKVRTAGNLVFNLLFSVATRRLQWDLGSGLCCYSCKFLLSGIPNRCSDDLTFNYTLQLLASANGVSQKFFPSSWVEDDQISNVKLFRQTVQMLKILLAYICCLRPSSLNFSSKSKFTYDADIVFQQSV